ncbi:MAG: TIGR00300 family protein [Planctomycetaceae bacterium]|nr:TIGR00300 family protein [Planctomycetaceae bacterium]
MPTKTAADGFVERVELSGHIIDSLLLPKVLDHITAAGGRFEIEQITVGQAQRDPSFAVIAVHAPSADRLQQILADIADHGAVPVDSQDARLVAADIAGAFPEGFYSTTNQRTEVRLAGRWIEVQDQEMDCGVLIESSRHTPCAVDQDGTSSRQTPSAVMDGTSSRQTPSAVMDGTRSVPTTMTARCAAMTDVKIGQTYVVGHAGVRVRPEERQAKSHGFEFMNSPVSTEKPKGVAIRQIALELLRTRREGGKALLVGGPAIVHTGSVEHVSRLLRGGYIHRLFAGNALATHDIEQALFGTSLGVRLDSGDIIEAGHEHHLRAINRIRRLGGIRRAVETGELKSGIMHECVKHNVEFLLAGSIRDDGPLPEVITDTLVAQAKMREQIRDVTFCLMVATTLHSIAVGNLLPAWVKVVCVDINPSTVIKLADRGSFQTVGLVTDVEPFFRALVADVELLAGSTK